MNSDYLNKEYWNSRYLNNKIGWDLGEISPPIRNWFDSQKK
jgi:thiopurine S-methyltransferase